MKTKIIVAVCASVLVLSLCVALGSVSIPPGDLFSIIAHKTFGFEPLLGFLFGKQIEIQSVRIIITGIKAGIPVENMRERLRDLYV